METYICKSCSEQYALDELQDYEGECKECGADMPKDKEEYKNMINENVVVEYPIVISATLNMIMEFQGCEYGAYEDWQRSKDENSEEEHTKLFGKSLPTYEILDRHGRKIEIKSKEELDEIYYCLLSGTFTQGDLDKKLQAKNKSQARRWIKKLEPALIAEELFDKYREYGRI